MTDSIPNPTAQLSVQEAAAEIVGLINTSPRSPWPSEIEAIVAKVARPASPPAHDEARAVDHAAWRKLVLEAEVTLRAKDLKCGDPRLPAAEAISEAAYERLHAFENAIWERPARSLGDIPLLADLLCYQMWPGYALSGVFPGNDFGNEAVNFDRLVKEGAYCEGEPVTTAAAALLRAIRDLVGPPKDQAVLVAPDDAALVDSVRTALVRLNEAEHLCVKLDNDDEGAIQACKDRWRDLYAAQAQIPHPPRSAIHVLLHAEIAYCGADKDPDGKLDVDDTDCFEGTAARLIEACVAYFGSHRHVVVRDL